MKRILRGDIYWLAALAAVTLFFLLPPTNRIFVSLTASHPYMMGFAKFAVLATMGELLALRLRSGAWRAPEGMAAKVVVWGIIGVLVTFMFSFFSNGVAAMLDKGLLPGASGAIGAILRAFYTSLIMNVTFGPVFMAAHRMSDTYIEMRARGARPSGDEVVRVIDWPGFFGFVIAKTIPFCWIPAHTAAFLLPGEYRVLTAAYLSIVLGVILVYARGKKPAAAAPAKEKKHEEAINWQ